MYEEKTAKHKLRSFLLTDDPKQALRIRHSMLAAAGYLLWIIAYIALYFLGLQTASTLAFAIICLLMLRGRNRCRSIVVQQRRIVGGGDGIRQSVWEGLLAHYAPGQGPGAGYH